MAKLQTTIGQLLINEALPPELRNYNRTLDKKGLGDLLREVGQQFPDKYRDVSHVLSKLGHRVAYETGGNSFGLAHLRTAKAALRHRAALQEHLNRIIDDDSLSDEDRNKQIISAAAKVATQQEKDIYQESLDENNPLAIQVKGAGRGTATNLSSLRGSDLLYTDHHGHIIPMPVVRSYSEGLDPASYFAAAYGARKGVMDVKFATQNAGYLSKQLNQLAHRLIVTQFDDDREDQQVRGLPVDVDDEDNEGALLAQPAAGYPRNTLLTPKILHELKAKGLGRILVRSPAVSGAPDGGLYSRDVGVRERGGLSGNGENVGLAAAQSLSEPLSQSQLSSKHSGGVATASAAKATSGFEYIDQLVQVPKVFKGSAAHAEHDGVVTGVEPAPAGGQFVNISGKKHYVADGYDLKVKHGDRVEAGDVISDGIPNPAMIVQHKGVGAGRQYFINSFRQAFRDAGLRANRRNIEILSRGLINHVRLQDEVAGGVPDDVMSYSQLEHQWEPREGSQDIDAKAGIGKYLEKPVLHYTIGTKIRPSMVKDLDEFGIKQVHVHNDPPPFEPEMIRGKDNLVHDPDWLTRMLGSNLQKGFLKSVHRGGQSNPYGTSYVPSLAKAVDFGREGLVKTPGPTIPVIQ